VGAVVDFLTGAVDFLAVAFVFLAGAAVLLAGVVVFADVVATEAFAGAVAVALVAGVVDTACVVAAGFFTSCFLTCALTATTPKIKARLKINANFFIFI